MLGGGLFTRDFLVDGVGQTEPWQSISDAVLAAFRARLTDLFVGFLRIRNATEADTEKELIWPLLEALGWADVSVQQNLSAKRRDDVPDALLFPDAAAKQAAMPLTAWQRFQHGACILEAKRWSRLLDRADARQSGDEGVPSTQMLRYLRRVDDVTNGGLRWGILTNGRHWRLYFRGALSVAEDFLEIDLGKTLDLPDCGLDLLDKRPEQFADDTAWRNAVLKLFLLMFGRPAFVPDHRGETFHVLALRQGKQWEAKVARDLSETVFGRIFPALARAIAAADGRPVTAIDAAYLDELRDGTLILLYRLLFVLYAEDRNLLPDESGPYANYSLTRLRLEIAEKKARGVAFSDRLKTFWSRLDGVFQAIGKGDDSLGIPEYNGGLFDAGGAPILSRLALPDDVVAETVYRLSHLDLGDRRPKYINYRDLSVQQLGSVYERILEHGLKFADGRIEPAESPAARKSSGSYYTPEELVTLIIERAVGPLVTERLEDFAGLAARLADDRRPREVRVAELSRQDPASRLLDLKICDPAMGSGHFLVSLVDWLSDRVLDAMAEAAAAARALDYISPVAPRIEAIRAKILTEARARRWPVLESQLDDRHIVRRMVLKRVVYGIDKNPMAVELAKVALWLHSFTVGAPLSFLDHHLRCGNSILGARVRPTLDALRERGALFNIGAIARVESVAGWMTEIEEMTDNDIGEVVQSKEKFGAVEDVTRPVAALFSLMAAEKLVGVFEKAPKRAPLPPEQMAGKSVAQLKRWRADTGAFDAAAALQLALEGVFGEPMEVACGAIEIAPPELRQMALLPEQADPQADLFPGIGLTDRRRVIADRLVAEARGRAARERFFHWEIGFPNVWSNLSSVTPQGGFDAVIGNPPYVRQELLGEEMKRALKADYAAFDGMADLYVYFFEQGLRLLRPGGRLSYVVTNKWLRAGYAEALRDLFAGSGRVEFIADFGHAKHFFPDADVFPSVVVVRKPLPGETGSDKTQVCVIPREAVPEKGLSAAVASATYPLPRACFAKEGWTLEPPEVMALLDKIRRNGVPLVEYTGRDPLYGLKTGLNEAFVIDEATRRRLVADDPGCEPLIHPFRRGQDIDRWWSPASGFHLIVMKSSGDFRWPWSDAPDAAEAERRFVETYPSLHRHMKTFERWQDEKTGKEKGLRVREDRGRFWWELRPCSYYSAFADTYLAYPDLSWSPSFQRVDPGVAVSNMTYLIPSDDTALCGVLNSPLLWWYLWRGVEHGKDEVLRLFTAFMSSAPIARAANPEDLHDCVAALTEATATVASINRAFRDWLRHEFAVTKIPRGFDQLCLGEPHEVLGLVRAVLGRTRHLSPGELSCLQQGLTMLEPARLATTQKIRLERRLSDLVNAAYGLTREEVALMWRTAPPRMPLDPASELRRLGAVGAEPALAAEFAAS